jgi:hypothetical protein
MNKFLNKFLLIAFAIASSHAQACIVDYSTSSDHVKSVMKRSNALSFDNYQSVCEKLNRANAALTITGFATVMGGRSVAWSAVGLKDKRLPIIPNDYAGLETIMDGYASSDNAESLLLESINKAVNRLAANLDQALASLDEARQSVNRAKKR